MSNEATARLRNYLKNSFEVYAVTSILRSSLKNKTKLNVGDSGFQQAYTNQKMKFWATTMAIR